MSETSEKQIGRNEPCPCGSGKKYKRCCGVAAAPKVTPPKSAMPALGQGAEGMGAAPGGFDPAALAQMNPELMTQLSQQLQRLPRGQMQRLQAIMQKAMAGKDVSRESAEFEKTLPLELQTMLRAMQGQLPGMMGMGAEAAAPAAAEEAAAETPAGEMTPEQARELVAKAAAEGKISEDQAAALLNAADTVSGGETPTEAPATAEEKQSGFSKLWKRKK